MAKIIFKDKRLDERFIANDRAKNLEDVWAKDPESNELVNLQDGKPQFRFADIKFIVIEKEEPKPLYEDDSHKGPYMTFAQFKEKHPDKAKVWEDGLGKKWNGKEFVSSLPETNLTWEV